MTDSIPERLPGCPGEVGDVNVTRKGCIFKVISSITSRFLH